MYLVIRVHSAPSMWEIVEEHSTLNEYELHNGNISIEKVSFLHSNGWISVNGTNILHLCNDRYKNSTYLAYINNIMPIYRDKKIKEILCT